MPNPFEPTRRRSPGWVRAMDSRQLHALAAHLYRRSMSADLTGPQEWLWDGVISELEYRARHWRTGGWPFCVCEFCIAPFVDGGDYPED